MTTRPFVPCLAVNPDDPEMECLSIKGHWGPHGVDIWPDGYQNGYPTTVEWD